MERYVRTAFFPFLALNDFRLVVHTDSRFRFAMQGGAGEGHP